MAANTGFVPQITFKTPIAEPQVAWVVSNTDTDNKGRVQVRFDWQKADDTTEFIRVLTPDAGSSDKIGKNRGFVAIPEVGDQVMVGFVHNHPDRPYVMGGLFHGKTAAGGGASNQSRSFSSKSGNALVFNDVAHSVLLKNTSSVGMLFDGGGNSSISSLNSNTIASSSKQLLQVGNVSSTKEGIKIQGDPKAEILMTDSGDVTIKGTNMISIEIGDTWIKMTKEGSIVINAKNIILNSTESISENSGGTITETANGDITIKGSQVDIN